MSGTPAELGFLAGLLRFVEPVTGYFFRHRRMAEAETVDLRNQLKVVLETINMCSVEAQQAVRGSPNEPEAQTAYLAAVRMATQVGQEFASLFDSHALMPDVPPSLLASRLAFRETVTHELNLQLTEPNERLLRCAEIEMVTSNFHKAICDEAFARWGVGLGAKSGRLEGRRRRGSR